jgi:hypothetical protein
MKVKPLIKRFSSQYWKSEITRAEERSKKFVEAAEESIRVYNAQKQVGIVNDTERRLNSWWYCVNTLAPAYFSSTPKVEVLLRKGTGGLVEELSSIVLERNVQYDMDTCFAFDMFGYNSTMQLLLTGRAVAWARYDVEIEETKEDIALYISPEGKYVDEEGEEYDVAPEDIKSNQGTMIIASVAIEKKDDEAAILEVVQYNDYLCSDARNETEIEWRARRAYLNRGQAEKLFGQDISDSLHFDSFPEKDKRDWNRDNDKFEGKAEVWEIWCKETDKVYWFHKPLDKGIILESDPPIDFEGFWPCVVIGQNIDPESVIPVSDYVHCKDQILEVERLTTRIHAVTQAIRTNFLYDAGLGQQVEQLLIGDLKAIPVINWPSYKQRGGLASSVEFMDIQNYVNALQILQQARETALNQLYETLKVSDLLRGTSEQYKSATANRLEAAWSSLGLIVRQNMFTKFISDGIEKLGTIIASEFDMDRIFEIGDANRLIRMALPPPPPPPPAPEMPEGAGQMMPPAPPIDMTAMQIDQIKGQIEELFRSEDKRCYRIRIASDSMIAIDQGQEQQEAMNLMTTASGFFDQMRGLIDQYPPLMEFSINLFQHLMKKFKGGKELDGMFSSALSSIGEIAKAKEEAAKQPPPPDPKQIEMQTKLQIAQMESQAKIQVVQMEAQSTQEKNMLMAQDMQSKMQREQLLTEVALQKAQLEAYVAEQELALKQQELQIKANAVQVDMIKVQALDENQKMKAEIATENNRMQNLLKMQEMEAKNMQFKLDQQEKMLEETRLSHEQQIERVRLSMDALQKFPQTQNPIIVQTDKPMVVDRSSVKKKRRGTIITDGEGNPVGIDIEDM